MKVIVAFYASNYHASEYRAGRDYISFASSAGFNLAVIADLEQNDPVDDLMAANPGISVVRLPSPVRKQALLHTLTDFIPQLLWHYRVANWLRTRCRDIEVLWVQNGAQPWLPLRPYIGVTKRIIWGPAGGGECPPPGLCRDLGPMSQLREMSRYTLETLAVKAKQMLLARSTKSVTVIPIARTMAAAALLRRVFPGQQIPVVPEILNPVRHAVIERVPRETPTFIWVGQDIARKNLQLALKLFARLKLDGFPSATLEVFGSSGHGRASQEGVVFHGWVDHIQWAKYRNDGVLLLTSYREGLPSVVLEAISNGLLCVATEVGAIPTLDQKTVVVLPRSEYPEYSEATYNRIISVIRNHLAATRVELNTISHEGLLQSYLQSWGVA